MNKEEKRFFIGDMVRDIFLLPQGDDPETLGIIIHIDIAFFKKEHEHPIALPRTREQDQIHVSWVTGELAGRKECVPEWFLRLVSRRRKGKKTTIYRESDEEKK
jgi:hypothetical protein